MNAQEETFILGCKNANVSNRLGMTVLVEKETS